MAVERATALERWAETEQMRGMERGRIEGLIEGLTKGRIETLRAMLHNIQDIYSDQIAQLLAAPLRPLALHEAVYILERALEDRDDAFSARVKQDVLAILNLKMAKC